jgi:hypothetical protein
MKFEKYITESMQRHCEIYKAKNKKWYIEIGTREYADERDSLTYGPFKSEKDAYGELEYHSNPGGYGVDESGRRPVPKKSPNGAPVQKPSKDARRGWGYY